MKFVILSIFAIFVAWSFHIAGKILVTQLQFFSKFWYFSKPFLTFSLSKCSILLNLLFSLFLLHLLLNLFSKQGKFSLLLRFFRNLRTSRSPSWRFLFVEVEFWKICYSPACYFCHICYSIFSHSKKKSCYFCDICYFFYTFLIAVFFKSFLLKLRKQFASKFLLTRSILDISEDLNGVGVVKEG